MFSMMMDCSGSFFQGKVLLPLVLLLATLFSQKLSNFGGLAQAAAVPVTAASQQPLGMAKQGTAAAIGKIDCLIDYSKGYKNAANIYQCSATQKCCLEFAQPSCCQSKKTLQIVQEQVTLWGGLFAILGLIGAIVCCRRGDFQCQNPFVLCWDACKKRTSKVGIVDTYSEEENHNNGRQTLSSGVKKAKKAKKATASDSYTRHTETTRI